MSADGKTGLQLRSLIKKSGDLEISLVDVPTPEPAADEVVVRVEAAPINPSDLGLLIGAADMTTAKSSGTKEAPVITAKVPQAAMSAMSGRRRLIPAWQPAATKPWAAVTLTARFPLWGGPPPRRGRA